MAVLHQECNLSEMFERFWKVEEPPECAKAVTLAEKECEDIYVRTTRRLASGRFSVTLPFILDAPKFGCTYERAKHRLISLERIFTNDESFSEEYRLFMNEYLELGHMSRSNITAVDLQKISHFFIPHHGVFQKGKKLRVVFDGSAKDDKGVSLNDCLHSGPPLQSSIVEVLTQFRLGRYALTCDIVKMFRQILVEESHRRFQLILWRFNANDPIEVFHLNTVTYGQRCAPYLSLRVLNQLAEEEALNFPRASEILLNNRYVDDLCFSNDSLELLAEVRDELIDLLRRGGFELSKWTSNYRRLVENFHTDHVSDQVAFLEKSDVAVKALGVCWLPFADTFTYRFVESSHEIFSKRELLSDAAKLYDPLGWISPVIVMFKMLVQESWVLKIAWDDSVPDSIRSKWLKLHSELSLLQNVRVPRYFGVGQIELHGFADASNSAYDAVVHVRMLTPGQEPSISLLMAKTKLAPVKKLSIPRLELCAAHLLSKLIPVCCQALNLPKTRTFLWSDSKVVLAWLHSLPRRWSAFVSNRVSDILDRCPDASWRYVKSRDNPADIPSRGLYPSDLLASDLWWKGPLFLYDANFNFSVMQVFETEEEQHKPLISNVSMVNDFWPSVVIRFSKFNRLVRSFAFVLRFIDFTRKRRFRTTECLDANEIEKSHLVIIRGIQETYFEPEITNLKRKLQIKGSSSIRKLMPFIDEDEILRGL